MEECFDLFEAGFVVGGVGQGVRGGGGDFGREEVEENKGRAWMDKTYLCFLSLMNLRAVCILSIPELCLLLFGPDAADLLFIVYKDF